MAADVPLVEPLSLRPNRVLTGHTGKIFALSWSADSSRLATVSQDESLVVWNAVTRARVAQYAFPSTFAMSCALHPTLPFVAAGGLDATLTYLDLAPSGGPAPVRTLSGHDGYISSIRFFSPRQLLSSSGDSTCALWDIERGARVSSFRGHRSDVSCVCPPPDTSTFVSGGCDGRAIIWDVRNARPMREYAGHRADINSVDFFPTGLSFATGANDGTCALFDIRADRQLAAFAPPTHPPEVNSVSFSRSGRLLFAAYKDMAIRAWDVLKGVAVWEVKAHDGNTSAISVNRGGTALASCGWDGQVKVWS